MLGGPDQYHVLYLTGPPAVGKSTLLAALSDAVSPLIPFSYSKVLSDYIGNRRRQGLTEDEIRRRSATIVSPDDIEAIDTALVKLVSEKRHESHIVIDSHAVTKESYGFRVTPFSLSFLEAIRPTIIIVLYTDPSVAIDRITRNAQGRPVPSMFEATYHADLQGTVALIYGIQLGIPIYFVDSGKPLTEVVKEVAGRLQRSAS